MSRVAVSADRRFHRAHTKPTRKRRLRRAVWPIVKHATILVVAFFAVYRGSVAVAGAPVLQIDDIEVRGNQRLPKGSVLALLKGLRGENILWSDLNVWRERLLEAPWVRDATIRRSLPSTIEVQIAERDPVGLARVKGRLYLVDERGGLIDEFGPQYADFDLPIIDGLAGPDAPDTGADRLRGELAARLIVATRMKPALARRLSQVDVSDVHNASVILNGDQAVIYVGEDRFLPRLESYLELSAALNERVAGIDYVDLRFDDHIYVRPVQKGAKRASEAR
jgi:cell division protein FtsQ